MARRCPRVRSALLCLAVLVLAAGTLSAQPPLREAHVLVLVWNDFPPAAQAILDAVRADLGAPGARTRVTVQFLDLVRFAGPVHDRMQADTLAERFRAERVDVLIALGPAVAFVEDHGARVWPGAKLVLAWLVGQRRATAMQVDAEAVVPAPDYMGTVEHALRLFPETARVVLMSGASVSDRQLVEAAHRALAPLGGRVTVEIAPAIPWGEVPAHVSNLAPGTLVVPVQHSEDPDGYKAQSWQFAEHVAANANRPVLVVFGTMVGQGALGGHVLDFSEVGHQVAALTLSELGRTPLPAARDPLKWQFDARQLARWGIDERRLPPGAQVLYREPSPWVRYRTQIMAVGAGLGLQSLIIAGLVVERRARRRALAALRDEEARRQRAEAQARVQLHEQSHVHTMAAMGQMAATMAHEMNQPLAAALSNAQALRRMLERAGVSDAAIAETLDDVIGESKRAGDVVKRIRTIARKGSVEFAPVALDQLAADVARLVEVEAKAAQVAVQVTCDGGSVTANGDRVQLLQVLLNLVQNAVHAARGSHAARVTVAVSTDPATGGSVLTVEDTGPGIPAVMMPTMFEPFATSKPDGLGLGLAICHTIVDLHGGEIHARNLSPRGAQMTVRLPVAVPG